MHQYVIMHDIFKSKNSSQLKSNTVCSICSTRTVLQPQSLMFRNECITPAESKNEERLDVVFLAETYPFCTMSSCPEPHIPAGLCPSVARRSFLRSFSLRTTIICAVLMLVAGCAGRHATLICAADARNVSGAPLYNVHIAHEPTGKFFSVGTLLPGRSFFLDFRERELKAETAVLNWSDVWGRPHTERLDMRSIGPADPAQPLRIVYVIGEGGNAGVEVRPCLSAPQASPR